MPLSALSIASSGLRAAGLRLEAAASNIANAGDTGRPADASGASDAYRPLDVRQTAAPGGGVAAQVVPRDPGFTPSYDPENPEAGANGMVAAPAVDPVQEFSSVLRARIDYAAAAKVVGAANRMMQSALDTFV